MPRIFDPECWIGMAEATAALNDLQFSAGRLNNAAIRIAALDDPYYMALTGPTYFVATGQITVTEALAREVELAALTH